MLIPRLWLLYVCFFPAIGQAAVQLSDSSHALTSRELRIFRPAIPQSRFVNIERNTFRSRCKDSHPPEPLATPTPPLFAGEDDDELVVSFVVGADGRVHSALILQGNDTREFRVLLNAVRHWRFRPATCNGAPLEVEDKIQFSHR